MVPLLKVFFGRLLFLWLLPVFFVVHGYVGFYDLIPLRSAFSLLFTYWLATGVLVLLCLLIFRKAEKATLFAFCLLCLYFFFGALQDFLQEYFRKSFVTRYGFLLPLFLLLFSVLFYHLKKVTHFPDRLFRYLNVVLILLLFWDIGIVSKKITAGENVIIKGQQPRLSPCTTCAKPDIYLIVTDGYSGNVALNRFFDFNNAAFEEALQQRGFQITDSSSSNYNYTVFSMGSMLNMNYLNTNGNLNQVENLSVAFHAIGRSRVVSFFEQMGYAIYNFSLFDLKKQPAPIVKTLMDFNKSPLTTQTFLYRLEKDIGYHVEPVLKYIRVKKQNALDTDLKNNRKVDSLTREVSQQKNQAPKFVYAHLMMPHMPYYFDSTGNKVPDASLLDPLFERSKDGYLQYLIYSNKKILELIDYIQQHNATPPVIFLVSDHGNREYLQSINAGDFQCLNLNAISIPGNENPLFYKGMSNVNFFRIFLNKQFGQTIESVKDSSIFFDLRMWDKKNSTH
jgi:hypothetical protein